MGWGEVFLQNRQNLLSMTKVTIFRQCLFFYFLVFSFFFHFKVESGEILASTISPFSGYHNMNSSGAVGDILVLTYVSKSQRKHCT